MYGWEIRMLLKHYLDQGVSKTELSRRFGVNPRTIHYWIKTALIDRLVHHCHIVNIRGNSYRMKDHQNLLQAGSDRRRKRSAS